MISTLAAEKSLINILLRRGEWYDRAKDLISSSDFSDESLGCVFKVFGTFSRGGSIDWTWETIAGHLASVDKVPADLIHPISYLGDIISVPPNYENFDFYINQIIDRKNRIKAKEVVEHLKISFDDASKSTEHIYNDIRNLEEIFGAKAGNRVRRVDNKNLWSQLKPDIEYMAKTEFVGTGFKSLDKHLVWGFAPGQLSLIGGRPSMGKSLFRSNIQNYLAKHGVFVLTITREQSLLSEYFRLIALNEGVDTMTIMKIREWDDSEKYSFISKAIKYMNSDEYPHRMILPSGMFFLRDVKREIIDSKNRGENPKVIFVDQFEHLDDFTGDVNNPARNIQQKLNEAADMATELGVHICLLAQLRRGSDKGPMNDAWKNSGGYEERARLTFQVFRPGKDDEDIEDNTMFVNISKQSDGPTAVIRLGYDPATLRLFEVADANDGADLGSSFL